MAPKKEKQDDEEIEAKVLLYMQTQNRPYSSTDVFQNMHGEIARAGINRALAALETRGELLGKTYGKQIVYVIKQSAPNDTGGDSKQAEEEECEKKDVEAEVDAVVRRASELRAGLCFCCFFSFKRKILLWILLLFVGQLILIVFYLFRAC